MQNYDLSRSCAQALDQADPLAGYRQHFYLPEPNLIYLDGNSLGRLPLQTIRSVREVTRREWGERLIRSWGDRWFQAPQVIGDKIGQLIGADSGQVVVSDSTSVNLFKLAMAALALRPERKRIVSDVFNFPSDLYILQGCIHLAGNEHRLHLVESEDGMSIDLSTLLSAIDRQTALVVLSHVAFKSGFLHDAAAVTQRANEVGALVLWDLSHSAGAVPVELDHWGAHLAVGCTYKYLNGGPGSPAYLYVRKELQSQLVSPIWGWFGQQRPFEFDLDYTPADGIARFLCGTPPVLSLLALEPGLDILLQAGIQPLRQKSIQLSQYLLFLHQELLQPLGFNLGSPPDPSQRGSHISLRHPQGYQINRALIEEMQVIPDFREPDNIRLGLAPLYTSFEDVWQSVQRICRVIYENRHAGYPAGRLVVT